MKTERMVIDYPSGMPLGILHKALAEAARQYGHRLTFEPMAVPRGAHYSLVPVYQRDEAKGAA